MKHKTVWTKRRRGEQYGDLLTLLTVCKICNFHSCIHECSGLLGHGAVLCCYVELRFADILKEHEALIFKDWGFHGPLKPSTFQTSGNAEQHSATTWNTQILILLLLGLLNCLIYNQILLYFSSVCSMLIALIFR